MQKGRTFSRDSSAACFLTGSQSVGDDDDSDNRMS